MKKKAFPGSVGSIEEYGDGVNAPRGEPTDMIHDSSQPSDGLVPGAPSALTQEQVEPMGYEGGMISPVDIDPSEGERGDFNWADDDENKKKAQITVYKGASLPLAVFSCGVAESIQDQVIGLQSYKSLNKDAGLLFKYSRPRDVLYHMGTVSFPIDILFINENNVIKRICKDIYPGSLATFGCAEVKYVLEIYGGLSELLQIDVGNSIEINRNSHFVKSLNSSAESAGFTKNAVLFNSKTVAARVEHWEGFPVISMPLGLSKAASKQELKLTSQLIENAPPMIDKVSVFYMDSLFTKAPTIKSYSLFTPVDDSWQGRINIDVTGTPMFTARPKIRDARYDNCKIGYALIRDSFDHFLFRKDDKEYNKEVDDFFGEIKAAYDNDTKIVFATTFSEGSRQLITMLKHKMSYRYGETIDLDRAKILEISDKMTANNVLDCVKEKYASANIRMASDRPIVKTSGIPVPDNVKKQCKEILRSLDRAESLVKESLEKMLKNKAEYEKHQDNENVISNTKGQFHQSIKRNTRIIKSYLIKIRDSIRLLNKIKDITTTLEIIDTLVSTSKASSDAAEEIFDMIDKVESPDFFIEFSAKTEGYENSIGDLIAAIERAKDYINSNVLGVIVLSE